MSQYGMQMPGGMQSRGPSMNVYTGLLLGAVIALAAACVTMYMQGAKIGPKGDAMSTHPHEEGKTPKVELGV